MSNGFHLLGTNEMGISTYFKQEGDKIQIVRHQDMDRMIEEIKAFKASRYNNGKTKDGALQTRALVPHLILEKWFKEEGVDPHMIYADDERYDAVLTKKLNDPDYAAFRTSDGRLGLNNGNLRMF